MAVDTLFDAVRVLTHGSDLVNRAAATQIGAWAVAASNGTDVTPGAGFVSMSPQGTITAQAAGAGGYLFNESWQVAPVGSTYMYARGATYEVVYESPNTAAFGDTVLSGVWGSLKVTSPGFISLNGNPPINVGTGKVRLAVEVLYYEGGNTGESFQTNVFATSEAGLKTVTSGSSQFLGTGSTNGAAAKVVIGSVLQDATATPPSELTVNLVRTQQGSTGTPRATRVDFRTVMSATHVRMPDPGAVNNTAGSFTYQAGSSVSIAATPTNSSGVQGAPVTFTLAAAGLEPTAALSAALQGLAAQIPGAVAFFVGSQTPTYGPTWNWVNNYRLDLPCTVTTATWAVSLSAVQNFSGAFYMYDGNNPPGQYLVSASPHRIADEGLNAVGTYAPYVLQGSYLSGRKTVYTATVTKTGTSNYYVYVTNPQYSSMLSAHVPVGDLASSNRVLAAGVSQALAGVFNVTEQTINLSTTVLTLQSIEDKDISLLPWSATTRASTNSAVSKLYGLRVTGRNRSRAPAYGNNEPYDFFLPPWPTSTIPPATGGGGVTNPSLPSDVLFAVSTESDFDDVSIYAATATVNGSNITRVASGSRTGDAYIDNSTGAANVTSNISYATAPEYKTELDSATELTIEFDIFVPTLNGTESSNTYFLSIGTGSSWANITFAPTIATAYLPHIQHFAQFSVGAWHHIAGVANKTTGVYQIFVDGVLKSSGTKAPSGFPFGGGLGGVVNEPVSLFGIVGRNDLASMRGRLDNFIITKSIKYTADFTPPATFADAVGSSAPADVSGAGYNDLEEFASSGSGNLQANSPDTYGTSNAALEDFTVLAVAYVNTADVTGAGTATLDDFTCAADGVAADPTNLTGDNLLDDFTSTADGVASLPTEFTADYTLDDFTSVAVGLFLAQSEGTGDATLDDFTVTSFTANITTPPTARAEFSLPMLKATASGSPAQFDGALVTLPEFTITARGGHNSSFSLPRITAEATGTTIAMARAIMTLPMVTLEATGRVAGQSSVQTRLPRIEVSSFGGHQAEITLPEITATATATVGSAAQAEFSLPRVTVTAHGYRDDTARADITLPMLVMTPSAVTEITLPAFTVLAHGQPVLTNAYEAYVMNMNQPLDDNPRNNFEAKVEQVTRYTNWPFIQVVRLGNAYYGVAEDGLYELGGTTDNGTEITWSFETCKTDFGDPHKKAVASAYIGGQAGATVDYTLRSGDDVDRMYGYVTTKVIQKRNHRQKFGLGRRVRYYSFGLAGSGKAAIDMLEFELLNTTRRI